MNTIPVSPNFRAMAIRSVISIIFFILVYFILIISVLAFTVLCGFLSISLLGVFRSYITLMIPIGVLGMGFLVIVFLVKFMFTKYKADRGILVEITRAEQPQLFEFIKEIVKEVKTDFPKKIYLSPDVNAAVFYDSSFWSMFFPIRKNLLIGVGLINSVTKDELKGVLAHEFGHFSQRSMKLGSYVYNVNKVIHNMLYDNESLEKMMANWASINDIFAIFVSLAYGIVRLLQWVLRKVYEIVNVSYMSLSREMEFHADEVAANVAGSDALATSLLRLDLAGASYDSVLSHYNGLISKNIKTDNIYDKQTFVMNFLAEKEKVPVINGLPQISFKMAQQFNSSKITIKDQWASHPSVTDRVEKLKNLKLNSPKKSNAMAKELFAGWEQLQTEITSKLFEVVNYSGEVVNDSNFAAEFKKTYSENTFNPIYQGYFDSHNPVISDIDTLQPDESGEHTMESLFGTDVIAKIKQFITLEQDIANIKSIAQNNQIKYFDYDGNKYKAKSAIYTLVPGLEQEYEKLKSEIYTHDIAIYRYFLKKASLIGKNVELTQKYKRIVEMEKEYESNASYYITMINATSFFHVRTEGEKIDKQVMDLYPIEKEFKDAFRKIVENTSYSVAITDEMKSNMVKYLDKDWIYYTHPYYNDEAVEILLINMNIYITILAKSYFLQKKDLLDFQASL